ncbi:hypothetical protein ACI2KR_30515 [Pseudomonas luteola]
MGDQLSQYTFHNLVSALSRSASQHNMTGPYFSRALLDAMLFIDALLPKLDAPFMDIMPVVNALIVKNDLTGNAIWIGHDDNKNLSCLYAGNIFSSDFSNGGLEPGSHLSPRLFHLMRMDEALEMAAGHLNKTPGA